MNLQSLIINRRRSIVIYFLLVSALWSVAFALSRNIRGTNLTLLSILILVGVSVCWLLSPLRLKTWQLALGAFLIGLFGFILYFSRLMGPIIALLKAIRYTISSFLGLPSGAQAGFSPIQSAIGQINAQWVSFIAHFQQWFGTIQASRMGSDALIIGMTWGMAFWIAVVWAGWTVFRYRQGLVAILPAGIILAGTLNYIYGSPFYLIPLLGTTLLLIALTSYDRQEQYWIRHGIDYAEDILFDLSFVIIFLSAVFTVGSAFAPSIPVQKVIEAGRKVSESYQGQVDMIARSLGLVTQSQAKQVFSALSAPQLPRVHLIGSGPELSNEVVMVISVGEQPGYTAATSTAPPHPSYYWRSTVYDVYTGHGWDTSPYEVTDYLGDQPAIAGNIPLTATVQVLRQTVDLTNDLGGLLYTAGQLASADKDYQVAWRDPPDLVGQPGSKDRAVDEFGALLNDSSYTAISLVNTINLNQLRTVSGTIPEWIKVRYLSLPSNLPGRVSQIAADLTENQSTPYDQAAAIESYLREITYTLDIPQPPADRDIVDYFLFDLKKGYCDYYATAMVVMARSVGLPARLVTGYATGVYDPANSRYVITQANAHSWAEVYLGGAGWVEFEPTGGLPALERLEGPAAKIEIPQLRQVEKITPVKWVRSISLRWDLILIGAAIALTVGICVGWVIIQWQNKKMTAIKMINVIYARFYVQSRSIVFQHQPGDTPFEFAARLSERFRSLVIYPPWSPFFKQGIGEVNQLTELYSWAAYSAHSPSIQDKRNAMNIWNRLRVRLWVIKRLVIIRRFINRLPAVFKRSKDHVSV